MPVQLAGGRGGLEGATNAGPLERANRAANPINNNDSDFPLNTHFSKLLEQNINATKLKINMAEVAFSFREFPGLSKSSTGCIYIYIQVLRWNSFVLGPASEK